MIDPHGPSPFTDMAAVETWDAWFRWRDATRLHDLSIEDTWDRVAMALASVEASAEAADWRARLGDALAGWRLLPDERLLADAGTGRITWRSGDLHAVLNVAAFVSPAACRSASLALPALAECAALAVRALDDAALLAGAPRPRLHVGLVAVADALALLGLAYDSDAGRAQAAAVARALAEGALRGSARLAAERGACAVRKAAAMAGARDSGAIPDLLRDLSRHGLRHAQLTAITSQRRLARLANGVADALDPLHAPPRAGADTRATGLRVLPSPARALDAMHAHRAADHRSVGTTMAPLRAQLALRAAMQPWIDAPIACPLLVDTDPGDTERSEVARQAARHGLGTPTWRRPANRQGP